MMIDDKDKTLNLWSLNVSSLFLQLHIYIYYSPPISINRTNYISPIKRPLSLSLSFLPHASKKTKRLVFFT